MMKVNSEIIYQKDCESLKKFFFAQKEKLLFIIDWDMTCTVHKHNGLPMAIMGVIRRSKHIPSELGRNLEKNYHVYIDSLFDLSIPLSERFKSAEEWWTNDMGRLARSLTPEILSRIIDDDEIVMREFFFDFLASCAKNEIPIVVFSAGIGNFIEYFFRRKNINQKQIYIVSNFIDFAAKKMIPPIIHSLNKNEVNLRKSKFYHDIENRKYIIVIGDHIDDHQMASSISQDRNVLKMGYLNHDQCPVYQSDYFQTFDLVLHKNAGFKIPMMFTE